MGSLRMRRLLTVIVFGVLGFVPSAVAAPVFFVEGHGWGHGIGLAQYGAQGFASRDDRDHAWILAHYYPGTRLAPSGVSSVRVLLTEGRTGVTIGSAAGFSVTDASDRTFQLPAGAVALKPNLRVTVDGKQHTLASPVRFARGSRYLTLGGRPYRGSLVVHSSGTRLSVVNHVGVEEYLYGVVPDEMPPSWHPEALKAQAVAARSYALVSRRTGGTFDLFSDTRSQVYGGVPSEDARTNAAIAATAGQVVTYDGRIAWTFFHSTSGGRTAAIHHVWNANPIPYLVSRADPHDDLSPYHSWGPFRYGAAQLRRALGSLAPRGALADLTVARNPSKRVSSVTARGSGGSSRFGGTTFQSRLGLRSSWFAVSVLSLGGQRRVAHGNAARLSGIARGFRTVQLERRVGNGSWATVRTLARSGDGRFTTRVKPKATTTYRLSSPKGPSPTHRVVVTPVVRFTAVDGRRALAGFVAPRRTGTRVVVERRENGRWSAVARTRTAARGEFRASLRLVPGRYRAHAVVGPGLARGVTPALTVVER